MSNIHSVSGIVLDASDTSFHFVLTALQRESNLKRFKKNLAESGFRFKFL